MVKRYDKGANFERRVKKELEDVGYFVVRSAGSKGKIDLVAMKTNDIRLIQCKTNGAISKSDKIELKQMSKELGFKTYLYHKIGTKVRAKLIR